MCIESKIKCVLEVSKYVIKVSPTIENVAKCVLKVRQNVY